MADEEEESAVEENHAGAGASDVEVTDAPVLNEDGDAFDWNNPKRRNRTRTTRRSTKKRGSVKRKAI